jgi:LmbE family N-acetylglucosaminyl deacetylase
MNPYLDFVKNIEAGVASARGISVTGKTDAVESASTVLLFSPHPDDECITGLLPLRLMRELGKQVVNVPVTFGSNMERRAARGREMADACAFLGWHIHREAGGYDPLDAGDIVQILEGMQPEIIFMPHERDWNSRHIETHFLVVEALQQMPSDFICTVVETEFWGAMDHPNLMVEGDAAMVADLVAATSLHVEEVARNPYHLRLPAWMQDNVRRGGELVGGQGGSVPDYSFATLYRLRKWEAGGFVDIIEDGTNIPKGAGGLKEVF